MTMVVQQVTKPDVNSSDSFSHGFILCVLGSLFRLGQGDFCIVTQHQANVGIRRLGCVLQVHISEMDDLL